MVTIKKILIYDVKKDSIAEEIGLRKGDYLISINDQEIFDILDYKFLVDDEYVEVEIEHEDGEVEIYEIEKDCSEDLGIVFEHELIDKPKNCHNKCIFCFMEQLPDNVRDTLIFKDDDYRLSFFTGNYITLTNLKDFDIDRIIRYRLSPINISIHATDEKVRCMMLNNRFAGKVLGYLDRFHEAGININTQIVLCKGINDGKILDKTIHDLSKYLPTLQSICIVPVGITKNREGLYPLKPLDANDCKQTVEIVTKYQNEFKKKYGVPVVYLADEFYLKSKMPFPDTKDYLNFGQIEDGIGMIPSFNLDFYKELKRQKNRSSNHKEEFEIKRKVTLITGMITEDFIKEKASEIKNLYKNIDINVIAIKNDYFGNQITVTGLVTGRDIINQVNRLKAKNYDFGDYIIIPEVMLKDDEDIFLDDTYLVTVADEIGMKIVVSDGSAKGFIRAIVYPHIPNKKIYKFKKSVMRQSYENSINH